MNVREKISVPEFDYKKVADSSNSIRKDNELNGKKLYHVYEPDMENCMPISADYFNWGVDGSIIHFYIGKEIVASFPNCYIVKLVHKLKENNE